jgi:hypothetical protein
MPRHLEKFQLSETIISNVCLYRDTLICACGSGVQQGGEYKYGHYMLTLADCRRQIHFEFPLMTARDRKNSLAKIDLLLEIFIAFRTALQKEAQLISDGGRQTASVPKEKRRK